MSLTTLPLPNMGNGNVILFDGNDTDGGAKDSSDGSGTTNPAACLLPFLAPGPPTLNADAVHPLTIGDLTCRICGAMTSGWMDTATGQMVRACAGGSVGCPNAVAREVKRP